MTSEAKLGNMTFPFVTLHNFEVFARDARHTSGVDAILYTPVVEADEIQAFNAYASEQIKWIEYSFNITNELEGTNLKQEPTQFVPFIFDSTVDQATGEPSIVPTTGKLCEPLWQVSPVQNDTSFIMVNWHSLSPDQKEILEGLRATQGNYYLFEGMLANGNA